MVQKCVNLYEHQVKYIKEKSINLSRLIQKFIDDEIKKEGEKGAKK